MKRNIMIIASILTAITLVGCSSTKQAKTYIMPCSDCVKVEDAIRVWASGTSNSETTARKKAMVSASAELAAVLEKHVETTTEEYTAALNDGEGGISKTLLNEQCRITVKKTVSGANIVCDEWSQDENGQYTNYIVLELNNNEFINELIEQVNSKSENKVNKKLLQEIFNKNVNKNK